MNRLVHTPKQKTFVTTQMVNTWWTILASLMIALLIVKAEAAPSLSLPLSCKPGTNCFVQNYVDRDLSGKAADYACGQQTYDGHKGTDIRILDVAAMKKGVRVVAAAPGRVKALRDGVADVSIRDQGETHVTGRECGNGVVVEHGDGWVTQYCHMKKDSLRVKVGQQIRTGTILGDVGLSGMTEFSHLHFEVRHGQAIIDPFSAESTSTSRSRNCKPPRASLWNAKTRDALQYRPVTLLSAGFTDDAPTTKSIERAEPEKPTSVSPAILAWVRVIGVRAGDVETIKVTDPLNQDFATNGPSSLEKSKAQWLSYAGRKRTGPSWPLGNYLAHYTLKRNGRTLIDREFSFSLAR